MRSAAESRAAILEAARRRFGQDGYERTTIRAVAADAGIDPAMVMRYFTSKEGLFAEAASFELHLPDLTGVAPEEVAARLLPAFFAIWEGDPAFLPLMRAASTSEAAAGRMRAIFAEQVEPALARVAVDRPQERAALVGALILGVVHARYILRNPPMAEMSREELGRWIGPVIATYLTTPA
jgi:AcrR family transcriptional regulator